MKGARYPILLGALLSAHTCSAADLYPKIREVILEAEAAAAGMTVLPDNGRPHEWAANLLARAGYLDNAKKAGAPVF